MLTRGLAMSALPRFSRGRPQRPWGRSGPAPAHIHINRDQPSASRLQPTVSSVRPPKLHRLQLRLIDPRKRTSRTDIFQCAFGKLNAPLTRLFDSGNGFYAATDDVTYIDKLLTDHAFSEFAKINVEPVLPPEIKSRRTIFVRQLDNSVGEHSPDELKTELTRLNPWAKISEIIKIKDYTHVFKIFCADLNTASRILTDGFLAFSTKISPSQCEQEEFTHILICYKCYRYEDHPTKDCKQTYDCCSECAQQGHTFKDCTATDKRCLNCPTGNNLHRTLAAKCPYRKKTIEDKKIKTVTAQKTAENKTYADIAKEVMKETKTETRPTNIVNLTNKTHLKLTALILEAHIASLTGLSYGQTLSDSLKRNFDIDAKFPDRDSQKIFNLHFKNPVADMMDDSSMDFDIDDESSEQASAQFKAPHPPKKSAKIPRSRSTSTSSRTTDSKRKATNELDKDLESVWNSDQITERLTTTTNPAQHFGLRLIMSDAYTDPIPDPITTEFIATHLASNQLKFSISSGDPDQVYKMLHDGFFVPPQETLFFAAPEHFNSCPSRTVTISTKSKKSKQCLLPSNLN